jgi:hypothetical protein
MFICIIAFQNILYIKLDFTKRERESQNQIKNEEKKERKETEEEETCNLV